MRQSITWVIADTHFNHEAIQRHCGRPADCDSRMIKSMRHLVAKQDLLVHLGDVIFYDYQSLSGVLSLIPGKKVLTQGNHDRKSRSWYLSHGFDFVCDEFMVDGILFSHKPRRNLPDNVLLNVHGHWHNMVPFPEWHDDKYFLVSVENSGYAPLNLHSIVASRQESMVRRERELGGLHGKEKEEEDRGSLYGSMPVLRTSDYQA